MLPPVPLDAPGDGLHCDVAIAGGGPAGLVLAAALAKRGLAVTLLERASSSVAPLAETLGPEVRATLSELTAAALVDELEASQLPSRGTRSAWGSDALVERPSLFHPLGDGWHVDRPAFDAALARFAAASGARLHFGRAVRRVDRAASSSEGFVLTLRDGSLVRTRYLVDASGRGAPVTRGLRESRWVSLDRQIALVARTSPGSRRNAASASDYELLLEASRDGWWYTAPRSDGSLVAVFLTDADLLPRAQRSGSPPLAAPLSRTIHTWARLASTGPLHFLRVTRADSGFLAPDFGQDWCAIGDASFAVDPLAGNGVARGLASVQRALPLILEALGSSETADAAASPGATADNASARDVGARVERYLREREAAYAQETRFEAELFWRRRRPGHGREAPLWLGPVARLARGEARADPQGLAGIEPWVPPRALAATLRGLEAPRPAHQLLRTLCEETSLSPRRILQGLQGLVAGGLLRVV